jgi:hypothetical protein
MNILNLPNDIIALFPNHIHTIEDFMNISSTCVSIRNILSRTQPNQILRMAAAQRRIFFRPDPHFLIAATARQLSDWALLSVENTEILREAFKDGVDALLDLCIEKCGITMEEIRRLHALRFTVLNPVADLIDRAAGKQWYATPNFWNGGASDAATVFCEPERALYQIIIYGELFSSTMTAVLQPELGLPKHDLQTRIDYITYCIPDDICNHSRPHSLLGRVESRGPYVAGNDLRDADQMALWHLLRTRKWREPFLRIRQAVGDEFQDENEKILHWRQKMWSSVVQLQGFDSIMSMQLGASSEFKSRLRNFRAQIEGLREAPETYEIGYYKNPGTEFPYMRGEVYICMAGYWQT